MMRTSSIWLASCAALTLLLTSSVASAVDCETLPSPFYGAGANAIKPLMKRYGTALSKASPPETLVYQAPGQCFGMNGLLSGTPITGTAVYWDAQGVETSCTLPVAGLPIDFAGMNSYATLCPGIDALPSGFGDFLGPVQSFDFIVPKASSQTSISAAAAYFVYGFGAEGQAAPWTDESQIFRRDQNSGVSLFVALAIGVPVQKLQGVDASTNANTITLVSSAPDPEKAIGMVSGEVAQANRDVVSTLAYQHYGQTCGYWPDSTPTALDKQHIRDGHYFIWSPIHLFAEVDGSGTPIVPAVERLAGYVSNLEDLPNGDASIDLQIAAGTVPDCAMQVSRDADLGDIVPYTPADPCGCYFESTVTGQDTCQACSLDVDCPATASHCRHGFCEVN